VNHNATCQVIAPLSQVKDTDSLQREHREEAWPAQRCRATRASITKEATVLSKAGIGLWDVRLQSARPIATGYRLKLTLDGETQARELEVLTANRTLNWHLSCRGGA
jgi:hypothetical protein